MFGIIEALAYTTCSNVVILAYSLACERNLNPLYHFAWGKDTKDT